jgi:hypothetical protein
VSKEETARRIMERDRIDQGLVCVLTCVEPCLTYDIHRDRESKRLVLARSRRKCLHVYQYRVDPEVGFCGVRLQTWFPFGLQVCLNGREWLSRRMDSRRLAYLRADNCFPWIKNFERAQTLMDEQLQTDWTALLERLAGQINPRRAELLRGYGAQYYWSAHQSEWATDVVFKDGAVLRRLYPRLLRQAMVGTGASDVLRFLGRPLTLQGRIHGALKKTEVTSDLKGRPEGLRIKHRAGGNSVKAYDKAYTPAGAVLRAETTMNAPREFKVYRAKEGSERGALDWRPLRKGVADMHRRAEVSQRVNERYLEALAVVEDGTTLEELLARVQRGARWKTRRVRALRPLQDPDAALLAAVGRGEFTLHGVRNRDLQSLLFAAPAADPIEARRRSARVSRQLMLLRAHGLIRKVPCRHRYQVTAWGRELISAVLAANKAPLNQLLAMAA